MCNRLCAFLMEMRHGLVIDYVRKAASTNPISAQIVEVCVCVSVCLCLCVRIYVRAACPVCTHLAEARVRARRYPHRRQ